MRVEPQKADAGAGERCSEDGGFEQIGAVRDGGHDDHDDHDGTRCETVQTVGEIHRVAHAHEQDVHEYDIEPRDRYPVADGQNRGEDAEIERVDKRDLDRRRHAEQVNRHEAERRCDSELADELRLGRKAERALLHDLRAIVDEPQKAGENGGPQKHVGFGRGLAHENGRHDNRHEHDDAAHSGRALLHQMAFRPVSAHLLADMTRLEKADPYGHEHDGHHDRDHDREEHEKRRILCENRKHISSQAPRQRARDP